VAPAPLARPGAWPTPLGRDPRTDPPSEEEYPDDQWVLIPASNWDGGIRAARSWWVRKRPDRAVGWFPLPSDSPDPPWQGPKRCGQCGFPRHVASGRLTCQSPIASVSLTKRPDPARTVGWWPMEWLPDGHEFEVLVRYQAKGEHRVEYETLRNLDILKKRVAWCPLAPLLELIPEDGA
jgi:hypothetical protein